MYERESNQHFFKTQTILVNSLTQNPIISKYGSYLALIEDETNIKIFERISGIYTIIQTIPGTGISDVSATDDFGYFGFSSISQLLIYKKSSNRFIRHQDLPMNFNVTNFQLEDSHFLIHG